MNYKITIRIVLIFLLFAITTSLELSSKKPFTNEDVMRFKALRNPILSDDGRWIAYAEVPERGNSSVVIQATDSSNKKFTINKGIRPIFSKDSRFVIMTLNPDAIASENAEKDSEKPKAGIAIVNLENGKITQLENVQNYKLANNSKWLAYKMFASDNTKSKDDKSSIETGTEMVLRHLESASELTFQGVTEYDFDSTAAYLSYIVFDRNSKRNGIYLIDLKSELLLPITITNDEKGVYSSLAFNHKSGLLAYINGVQSKDKKPDSCSIIIYDIEKKEQKAAVEFNKSPKGLFIPLKNELIWSKDGQRLFFGFKPTKDTASKSDKVKMNDSTFFDIPTILKKTQLQLWHTDDKVIKTQRENWWQKNKDYTYLAVFHLNNGNFIQLADSLIPDIQPALNSRDWIMGATQVPYLKETTWFGEVYDLYLINMNNGERKLIAQRLTDNAELSPLGKVLVYFKDKHWFLYDTHRDTTVNLTNRIMYEFYDDEFDEPREKPSFGIGGWVASDSGVVIYDKYDPWLFETVPDYGYINLSLAEGRISDGVFRLINLDPDRVYYQSNEVVYLSGFSRKNKNTGIFETKLDLYGVMPKFYEPEKKYNLIAKAKHSEKYLLSRESFEEFPDLWVADTAMKNPRKITDINPQMKDFIWGKAEIIRWVSYDGDSLDGFLIKPDNYIKGKRYPVLVYFYDKFSNTTYDFYQPYNNHRPCYQVYLGDGYLIFVPDIKYKTGQPGMSAYNCIVSGVRKIIELGYADSNAIGIQGHSWGGYQTAYLVTKTNLFSAACAGAPVGNMTSAYSGIRLESGLARQFQYERYQSRIGGTLWDSLSNYIQNSPVFLAEKTKTPFMLMFGDEDGAVPWQQGIEIYLAWRRLGKFCVMLQYNGEPHIPRKYHNKLDYAIKMKEFFDTFLMKKTAPEWLLKGIE